MAGHYFRPGGAGTGDGTSFAKAADLNPTTFAYHQASAVPGDNFYYYATEHFTNAINLNMTAAGTLGNPISHKCVFPDLRPEFAYFDGWRPNPYFSNSSAEGPFGFVVQEGAQYQEFDHFWFRNYGLGTIQTASSVLTKPKGFNMMEMTFDNCAKYIYSNTGTGFQDFVWRKIHGRGNSKHALNSQSSDGSADVTNCTTSTSSDTITMPGRTYSVIYNGRTVTGPGMPTGVTVVGGSGSSIQLSAHPTANSSTATLHLGALVGNYGWKNGKILDIDIDTDWQYGDSFAGGIGLGGGNDNIEITGGKIRHGWYDLSASTTGKYWNGDGISCERTDTNIKINYIEYEAIDDRRTSATIKDINYYGSDDSGFDSKSPSCVLSHCKASGSKHNMRLWFVGTEAFECELYGNIKHGGTGSNASIQAGGVDDITGPYGGGSLFHGGIIDTQGSTAQPVENQGSEYFRLEETIIRQPTGATAATGLIHELDNIHEVVDYS